VIVPLSGTPELKRAATTPTEARDYLPSPHGAGSSFGETEKSKSGRSMRRVSDREMVAGAGGCVDPQKQVDFLTRWPS
jgi:hypothetical protein